VTFLQKSTIDGLLAGLKAWVKQDGPAEVQTLIDSDGDRDEGWETRLLISSLLLLIPSGKRGRTKHIGSTGSLKDLYFKTIHDNVEEGIRQVRLGLRVLLSEHRNNCSWPTIITPRTFDSHILLHCFQAGFRHPGILLSGSRYYILVDEYACLTQENSMIGALNHLIVVNYILNLEYPSSCRGAISLFEKIIGIVTPSKVRDYWLETQVRLSVECMLINIKNSQSKVYG
jgi:hypothetical protein